MHSGKKENSKQSKKTNGNADFSLKATNKSTHLHSQLNWIIGKSTSKQLPPNAVDIDFSRLNQPGRDQPCFLEQQLIQSYVL